ncbi:MAG: hypothetical protein MZW92_28690 [Comamonadaceae bacterium]|nr:hypothetical protein [Comamonadaceae bacterium]
MIDFRDAARSTRRRTSRRGRRCERRGRDAAPDLRGADARGAPLLRSSSAATRTQGGGTCQPHREHAAACSTGWSPAPAMTPTRLARAASPSRRRIDAAWQALAAAQRAARRRCAPLPDAARRAAAAAAAWRREALAALPPPPAHRAGAWRIGSYSSLTQGAAPRERRGRPRRTRRAPRRRGRRAPPRARPPTTSCASRAAPRPASACTRCSSTPTSPTPRRLARPSRAALRPSRSADADAAGADAGARRRAATPAAAHAAATLLARRAVDTPLPASAGMPCCGSHGRRARAGWPSSSSSLPAPAPRAPTRSAPRCASAGYARAARCAFGALDGYLRGFIDLVFEHARALLRARLEVQPPRRHAGRLRAAARWRAMATRTATTCSTLLYARGAAPLPAAAPAGLRLRRGTSAACSTCSCAACARAGATPTARRPAFGRWSRRCR